MAGLRFALVLLCAAATTACERIECGEGTAEVAGYCVAGSEIDTSTCGEGTFYDPMLQACVTTDMTKCDRLSTTEAVDVDGLVHCIAGGDGGCALACPQPDPGRVTVCGELVDGQTGTVLADGGGALCDDEVPALDGPCSLGFEARDAVDGTALGYDSSWYNDCGHFVIENLVAPPSGLLSVVFDDAIDNDRYVPTKTILVAVDGQRSPDQTAFALRRATDAAWTASAGDPFAGTSFAERGLAVAVFRHRRAPVGGVIVTAGGAPTPSTDYYFGDIDVQRSTIDVSMTATGANGSALWVDGTGSVYSGQGRETVSCVWPAISSGVTAAGTAVFHIVDSVDPGTGEVCE